MFSLTNKTMNEIFPNLYIGNQEASATYGSQFDMVVNCTPDVPFAQRRISDPDAAVTVRIAINDHPSQNPLMLEAMNKGGVLERMHDVLQRGRKVLVHCHAGMQRSCAVVAFYMMKYYDVSLKDAMAFIRQNRPVAFYGGATFLPALQQFERTKNM
jgi:protein-tyrosine phosphatase